MSEDQKEAAEAFKKTVDITNGLINVGKASLEYLKDERVQTAWKNNLAVVAGAGDIIKGIIKFVPTADNPMVKQMQDLADRVEVLGEKVSTNFDEMEALITEINFFVRILSPTFNLTRYMRECFKRPGKEANENFLKAYKRHPPLKLTYNLLSYLEQESTNPLKHAMDAENPKKKATFKKWEDIFSRIMGQFMFIEAFAKGLQGHKSLLNIRLLFAACINIFDKVEEWKLQYAAESPEQMWGEIRKFLGDFMSSNSKLSNAEKADKIKEKVDSYMIMQTFYIVVFDKSQWQKDYTYYPTNAENIGKVIGVWDKGCYAFVYMSIFGKAKNSEQYSDIKEKVEACRFGKITYNGSLSGVIANQLIDKNFLFSDGFTSLIWEDTHPEIRSANCPDHKKGPGWWDTVEVKDTRKQDTIYKYHLLHAFD